MNSSATYPHPDIHDKFPEQVYEGPCIGRVWEDAAVKYWHVFRCFGLCVFMRTLMPLLFDLCIWIIISSWMVEIKTMLSNRIQHT